MTNILLCGNGINIQFNEDFCFKKFLDILTDEKKLENLIDEVLLNPEYQKFNSFKQEFLEIFEKCRDSILNLDQESKSNGVEIAILNFKNSVRVLMLQSYSSKKQIFEKFEEFFDLLFFYYLNGLQEENIITLMKNTDWSINLKDYLKRYQYIYTLNYDGLLAKIYNEKYIRYVHGKLKIENNKLDYKNCIFESYLTPKWMLSRKTYLPIFVGMGNLKGEFCLDIVGLNPKNDEDIFCFFFLSKVCKEINYYYHPSEDNNDFKNMLEIINMIEYWNTDYQGIELVKSQNFVEIKVNQNIQDCGQAQRKQKIQIEKGQSGVIYKFKFWNDKIFEHELTLNLKSSEEFWNRVNKKETPVLNDSKKEDKKETIFRI